MKIKLKILNKQGFVQEEFKTETINDNIITLSIDGNILYFNSEGRLYVNEIKDVFAVKYINPNEFKGSALYFYTYATDDHDAKTQAISNPDFISQINMKNFDRNNFSVVKPNLETFDTNNIGKIVYYEQDPII
jgi:hypothetical protein